MHERHGVSPLIEWLINSVTGAEKWTETAVDAISISAEHRRDKGPPFSAVPLSRVIGPWKKDEDS
jgi:hypothetical protein